MASGRLITAPPSRQRGGASAIRVRPSLPSRACAGSHVKLKRFPKAVSKRGEFLTPRTGDDSGSAKTLRKAVSASGLAVTRSQPAHRPR